MFQSQKIKNELEDYQKYFIQKLNQGFLLSLSQMKLQFSLDTHQEENLTSFSKWFSDLFDFYFLPELPDSLEEIFLRPNLTILKTRSDRTKIAENLSQHDLFSLMTYLSLKEQKNWNFTSPFSSFFLKIRDSPYRATLIHPSTNQANEPRLFLRKIAQQIYPIQSYFDCSETKDKCLNLLKSKKNILIAGSTGSGKTSFLSSFLNYASEKDHLVILEDTHEVQTNHEFESRFLSGNEENKSLKDYCSYALRMSPDRLILGEMRGKEIVPFYLSMNTGHKGLMGTIHSNSAVEAISRSALLFTLFSESSQITYQKTLQLICQGIDYVFYLENKKVSEIIKVLGHSEKSLIYDKVL